jgi:limonene-1,2-epoxide hydrolase
VAAEEVVTNFIAAIERGDIDAAMEHVAPDCEYDNVPIGKNLGVDAIRQALTTFVTPENPPQFRMVRQVAQGNVVFNERVDRLLLGSREITVPVAGVWEVDPTSNLITLWRDYFDMTQVASPPG